MLRMVAPQGLAIRTEMEIYYLKDSSWNFFMEHWPLERNINTNTPQGLGRFAGFDLTLPLVITDPQDIQ